MIGFLRRLFRPERHYPAMFDGHLGICNCGFYSEWDIDLSTHLQEPS